MSNNGYLQKQKQKNKATHDATRETYEQYLTDTLILTLNDPEIMGKDVFGEERIHRVLAGWGKKYDEFFVALTNMPEADYCRDKLDKGLKRICRKGQFVPFEKRYRWLPEIKYVKKHR